MQRPLPASAPEVAEHTTPCQLTVACTQTQTCIDCTGLYTLLLPAQPSRTQPQGRALGPQHCNTLAASQWHKGVGGSHVNATPAQHVPATQNASCTPSTQPKCQKTPLPAGGRPQHTHPQKVPHQIAHAECNRKCLNAAHAICSPLITSS